MIKLKTLLTEMPIHKKVYGQIGAPDRIIMSAEPTITPRNVDQPKRPAWKPRGLWYAIGTEWIDWTRDNMPEWETDYAHRAHVDESKILRLGHDMTIQEFESRFGAEHETIETAPVCTAIHWWKVKAYKGAKYAGIEVMHPWGGIGSWLRTWDVSSGCIWNPAAIKSIETITLTKTPATTDGIDTPDNPNM
jgi:hypothetical protein